jgi:hypothetical protein
MKSVGNNVTNDLSPSEYGSSVLPHFIADSVGNKKTNHRRSYKRQRAAKIFFSRENITNGIHPSAFSMVITGGLSVGDGGMTVNVSELYQIPTDIFRR